MNDLAVLGNSKWMKPAIFLILAVGMFVVWLLMPVKDMLQEMLGWMQELGGTGLVVLAAAYILACVLLVPGSILTLGAGFLAAAIWPDSPLRAVILGTVTVSLASITGASFAFLLGRTLARDWVAGKVRANKKFSAIDQAVGRAGFKMVFLVRLSPIFPFNLLNYALGLTKVRFRAYFLASWIGMLPGTVMYVYLGSTAQNVTALAAGRTEANIAENILLWLGLFATILVVVFIARTAKRALAAAIPESAE